MTFASEPIAVVGMSFRAAGAPTPAEYWALLYAGRDAIGRVPAGRWNPDLFYHPEPGTPGHCCTREGGFLVDVDGFDSRFFRMSEEEARAIDPQQRMLLEFAWEALESAAIPPRSLVGERVGLFVGQYAADHGRLIAWSGDPGVIGPHTSAGCLQSMSAGRIAYHLALRGPAVTIDTACSSSAVAVHLACTALRGGEIDLALAGGLNVLLSPDAFISLSQAGMLSPDGRCKAFDASADGYGRGEGGGLVALCRLSHATAQGLQVLGLILGSATNHDGRSSSLAAPSGIAQQDVIRDACARAGVSPDDVDYVEAHGTGTPLGDPTELKALAKAFASRQRPLLVGSCKANVGHIEGGAGVAGLIKALLVLKHGVVPPQPHFHTLNRRVRQKDLPLLIPSEPTPLLTSGRPRVAGVSSFGLIGTNAHLVLADAPRRPEPAAEPAGPFVLTVSARTPAALRTLAAFHVAAFEDTERAVPALCRTSNLGRNHFEHRLAVVARTRAEFIEALRTLAAGTAEAGVIDRVGPLVNGTGREAQMVARAQAHVEGKEVDWAAFHADYRPTHVTLPTYPFERQSYRNEGTEAGRSRLHAFTCGRSEAALGQKMCLASGQTVYQREIDTDTPGMGDHRLDGVVTVPGATHAMALLAALGRGSVPFAIEGLEYVNPLVLERGQRYAVQITVTPSADGPATAEVAAADQADGQWLRRAAARTASRIPSPEPHDLAALQRRCPTEWTGAVFYERMSAKGFNLGPSFQWVEAVHVGTGEALARMRPARAGLTVPDSLFDACFQVLAACLSQGEVDQLQSDHVYVPFGADRVTQLAQFAGQMWCHARLRPGLSHTLEGHSVLYSGGGEPLLVIDGIRVGPLPRMNRPMVPAEVADGELTRDALLALPPAERKGRILGEVRRRLAAVLREAPESVDPDATLTELGVDSMDGLGLAQWLDAALEIRLPLGLLLCDPTPAELIDGILTALDAPSAGGSAQEEAPLAASRE
jgi:acyl transferase domain-containing protein